MAAKLVRGLRKETAPGERVPNVDPAVPFVPQGPSRGHDTRILWQEPNNPVQCPGNCGCRLGTDDADRFECGCPEGCCD